MSHKNLNLDVPFLTGKMCSTEVLTVEIWNIIADDIKGQGAELHSLKLMETENNLLGSVIGDYVKTGISTMLNTGTYIGIGSVVFGSEFQKKNIKQFSWGDSGKIDFEKFIDTASKVKERRDLSISDLEKKFLYRIYNNI